MTEQIEPLVGCDLHTHSVHSGHAFSTVDELAAAAAEAGLQLIAITDHGPSMEGAPHPGYFEMAGRLPPEIRGVKVLMGIEANIVSLEGDLDLSEAILKRQQLVVAGLHERTGFPNGSRLDNTRAITRAMEGGLVHVISHPYRPSFGVDVKELARVAAGTGVYLEVNVSLIQWALARTDDDQRSEVLDQTRLMIEEMGRRGAFCVVSSDAHHSSEVRAFPKASREVLSALSVPLEIVKNRRTDDVATIMKGRR